jgi:hypothetical protein
VDSQEEINVHIEQYDKLNDFKESFSDNFKRYYNFYQTILFVLTFFITFIPLSYVVSLIFSVSILSIKHLLIFSLLTGLVLVLPFGFLFVLISRCLTNYFTNKLPVVNATNFKTIDNLSLFKKTFYFNAIVARLNHLKYKQKEIANNKALSLESNIEFLDFISAAWVAKMLDWWDLNLHSRSFIDQKYRLFKSDLYEKFMECLIELGFEFLNNDFLIGKFDRARLDRTKYEWLQELLQIKEQTLNLWYKSDFKSPISDYLENKINLFNNECESRIETFKSSYPKYKINNLSNATINLRNSNNAEKNPKKSSTKKLSPQNQEDQKHLKNKSKSNNYNSEIIEIGELGENFILNHLMQKLKKSGKNNLANNSKRMSKEYSNIGYDILSFDEKGNEMHIEVKTSTKNNNSFYITNNEKKKFEIDKKYKIYRVINFNMDAMQGDIEIIHNYQQFLREYEIRPISFKVSLNK